MVWREKSGAVSYELWALGGSRRSVGGEERAGERTSRAVVLREGEGGDIGGRKSVGAAREKWAQCDAGGRAVGLGEGLRDWKSEGGLFESSRLVPLSPALRRTETEKRIRRPLMPVAPFARFIKHAPARARSPHSPAMSDTTRHDPHACRQLI